MTPEPRPLDVAVGVLRNAAGKVLVNQRTPGRVFAGQWEFPGGKLRAGETVDDALARELDEELGIRIGARRPLITLTHRYDDFTVRLNVMEVLGYGGEPRGREGQALRWAAPAELDSVDLLAANVSIVQAIKLPRVCLITDLARFGAAHTLDRLERHVESAPVLLIVREKKMGAEELTAFVSRARGVCRAGGSLVCVHADGDPGVRDAADGVHWPARALHEGLVAPTGAVTGASCHDAREIRLATGAGASYVLVSPVKHTASHPSARPLGWRAFEALCSAATIPVYALGGMGQGDRDAAMSHGAQGAAMLSAAWQ